MTVPLVLEKLHGGRQESLHWVHSRFAPALGERLIAEALIESARENLSCPSFPRPVNDPTLRNTLFDMPVNFRIPQKFERVGLVVPKKPDPVISPVI